MFSAFQTFGRLGAGGLPFSERALWPQGASSPGLWIDPSYSPSEFQDSAGTTPLSTIGTVLDSNNPVGLVLDRKAADPYGPEMATNGDASNALAGWSTFGDASPSVSGGRFIVTSTAAGICGIEQTITGLEVGKTYRFFGKAKRGAGGSGAYVTLYTPAYGFIQNATYSLTSGVETSGASDYTATMTSVVIRLQLLTPAAAGDVGEFDDISFKKLNGIHLSQSTSAARPVASARVNLLTKTEDFSAGLWGGNATKTSGASDPLGGNNAYTITASAPNDSFFTTIFSSIYNGVVSSNGFWARRRSGSYGILIYNQVFQYTTTLVTITDNWGFYTLTNTSSADGDKTYGFILQNSGDSIDIFHPQVNLGSTALPYQRVGADSDYDTTGFPIYTKFDGTDDALASATFAAGTLTSSMDCLIAVRRDSTSNTVVGLYNAVADATKYFGMAESGSSSGCVGSGAGTPTVWVDGVQLSGGTAVTRGTLHTALTVGAWHILEFRGLDLSTWTAVGHGLYTSYVRNGALGKIALFASGQDANRDKARARMAAYFGVTLP